MGWLWGSSDSNDSNNANNSKDPMRDLDPSLRDFLAKESPVKYDTSSPPSAPEPVFEAPKALPEHRSREPSSEDDSTPKVPARSLYKDGRYAHLWKTYESQSDVENAGKSDQEKVTDILEGFKYRRAEIGRAALENCALEQYAVNDCYSNGDLKARLTLCRVENRSLERCYTMQAKFLKALGYLSTLDRPPELDEQIQMHADTLYHRMLAQEKAIEEAKKEGLPIPTFPSLLSNKSPISTVQKAAESLEENRIKPSDLSEQVQSGLKERLEGLSAEDRELEERAIKAEIQAGEQVAGQLGSLYQKQDEERRLRKEQGKETIGDRVQSIFGWR